MCLRLYVFTCFSPRPAYKFLALLLPSLTKVFTLLTIRRLGIEALWMQLEESNVGDESILIDVDVGGALILNKVAAFDVLATLAISETDVDVDVSIVTDGD